MFCKKCGSKLSENEKFCSNCGVEISNQNSTEVNTEKESVSNISSSQNNYGQNIGQNHNNTNNNIIYIVIGIAVVAFIALILLVFILLSNKNKTVDPVDPGNVVDPVVTPTTTNYYKVNYKDFTFKIPEDMIYDINGEQFMLGDEDGTWMAYLNVVDGSFNQVKNINGVEFVTLELTSGGESVIAAYTKLNSMKVAYFVAFNQNYTIDYDLLKKLAPIVSNAVYSDSTFNMEIPSKFNFNMNEISEFAK